MKFFDNKNYIFFSLILLVFILGAGYILVWQGIYSPKQPKSKELKVFKIEKGEGLNEIADKLERNDLIKNDLFFSLFVFLRGDYKEIKAGSYLISPSDSIAQIANKVINGKTAEVKVTIPEGFTVKDIENRLKRKKIITDSKINRLSLASYREEFEFLRSVPEKSGLEGYLFPDTYQISYQETSEEIVSKMLLNFEEKLSPRIRKDIESQNKTIFEIITMASLLEKEVVSLEDRKKVSGILWKRLNYGIPLQADATITYITGKNSTKISKKELEIDSPYNTYENLGLPLGPICNPGLESILAAVYPKSSDFWYYLSTPDGETKFSKTNEQHNWNKYKYLK